MGFSQKCESGAIIHKFFIEFSRKLCVEYLQFLMNTYAKFKVNQTETVEVVVQTSIIDGIFTKFASCTFTTPNGHFCQV